jgi:glycosyltransferase involved in cell wall biosynthesis
LKLIVLHHHYRPGGIRRVIELAAPWIVRSAREPVEELILAGGEPPDLDWQALFARNIRPATVRYFIDGSFSYFSEQKKLPEQIARNIQSALDSLFDSIEPDKTVVWYHNPGIARNLLLTEALARACHRRDLRLLFHHHDWWFDNRWLRWAELRRSGFATLSETARSVFPPLPNVQHATINEEDALRLKKFFPGRAHWIPNPAHNEPMAKFGRTRFARRWLQEKLESGNDPIWILPCRVLRRKNLAEALLLTRWLRPSAWLVVTGGPSSADEERYAHRLVQTAEERRWKFQLGLLRGPEPQKPSIPELLAASETVLLTSLQEGFGLPFLEAAAAHRPLIARQISNIAPDLRRFGFRFPYAYKELLIDPALFDWNAERKRQSELFSAWLRQLPRTLRPAVGRPPVLESTDSPRPVPFSRLTLTAQLEVLCAPVETSWNACARLNPFLRKWRRAIAADGLRPTHWPQRADSWLSGLAYGRRFWTALAAAAQTPRPPAAVAAQQSFLRDKLAAGNLYPLLWSRDT